MRVLARHFLRSLLVVMVLSVMCAGVAFADYAYYFPYFSNSTSKGEVIGLALANTTAAAAKVKIAIIDQDGVTQKVESWDLPAYGQRADVIGADLDTVEGSFQVLSDQPLTGLAFLFAHQMRVMYDLPMTQTTVQNLDIPQADQDTEWGMRILVDNPQAQAVDVAITYRAADGSNPTSAYMVNLKAYGSAVIDLADLLSGWELTELDGGCLHLNATGSGIVAFATYDTINSGGTFYAGLSAVDPSKQENNFDPIRSQYAVVACAIYGSSGAHALLDVDKPRSLQDNLLPSQNTDFVMAALGEKFYRIARMASDNVTKFSASAPATPIWQYTTMDENDVNSSNPQSMIFASSSKAYIPRFGSTKMWIVNPDTTTEAGFKIGEVELADYADEDGFPEMTQGVIVDGKLFLLLQRLDQNNNWTPGASYLAVIDTATDMEIDVNGQDNDGLKGIPLPIKNPKDIVYKNGKIYVSGIGGYAGWDGTPADYSGGIISVDPATYAVSMVVDDGDENEHPYGNFTSMTVVSATKGYFVGYAGWGDNALYSFNPATGAVSENPLAAFPGGANIAALGVDGSGMLWVASNTFSGGGALTIINPADDSVDQVQKLNLNPQGIAFGTWE